MKIELINVDWITIAAFLAAFGSILILWFYCRKRLLVYWRAAVLMLLFLMILQPAVIKYKKNIKPSVAVAADISASMKISKRNLRLQKYLEKLYPELNKKFYVKYYSFGADAVEIKNVLELQKIPAANSTDISNTLHSIGRDTGGKISGILLFSDGNHNAGALPQNWLSDLNIPVFPVAVNKNKKVKDTAVNSVRVSDFAFKNMPVEITAVISASGYKGKTITVNIKNKKNLCSKNIVIESDKETKEVNLSFVPESNGEMKCIAAVEPFNDEITIKNNAKEFVINVNRDKLRLLYICGRPGYEYEFLRHEIKNDPLAELVSFVILRNPDSISLVNEADLALIPFPVNNIFTKDLKDFDILILENFSYKNFGFSQDYMLNIKNWVINNGGGLLMIGGENSFGAGGWSNTPVDDILPVICLPQNEKFDDSSFKLQVTDYNHPIVNLNDDKIKNKMFWDNMPELEGSHVLQPKPGASVIAKNPWNGSSVIAAWNQGKGRVIAIGTNTTWRWAMQSSTPEFYTKFWKNTVRYLGRINDEKKLRVFFDKPQYSSGERFVLKVKAAEENKENNLKILVITPSGSVEELKLIKRSSNLWDANGIFEQEGSYKFRFVLEKNGSYVCQDIYKINAEASTFLEESDLNINEALLKQTADLSGGEYFDEESFSIEKIYNKLKKQPGNVIADKKFWGFSLWLFFAVICVLAGEWIYRKRKGLL